MPNSGAWARLVCSNGTEEHLALCEEAMKEIQEETLRKHGRGQVQVPDHGRFIVSDGKVYRILSMWLEQGPLADGREKWGVVVQKEKHS